MFLHPYMFTAVVSMMAGEFNVHGKAGAIMEAAMVLVTITSHPLSPVLMIKALFHSHQLSRSALRGSS